MKRGRKSGAELSVVSSITMHRPAPPSELTDEQAQKWREIVNRMPADWFPRETHGLLMQYCRHSVTAWRMAQLIVAAEGEAALDMEHYERLLRMQDRESRAMAALARSLRLTLQSRILPRGAGRAAEGNASGRLPPWESSK